MSKAEVSFPPQMNYCLISKFNKNAFQYDAYHPLRWPGGLSKGSLCTGGVQGSLCAGVGLCDRLTPRPRGQTHACENITLPRKKRLELSHKRQDFIVHLN